MSACTQHLPCDGKTQFMGPGAKQQTKIIDIMQIAIGYDPPGKYISDYCRRTGFRPVLYMQKNSIIFRQGLFKMRHHD